MERLERKRYTAVHKLWNQTILFGIMGTVSFGLLYGTMMFELFIEEINDWSIKKWFNS